MSHAGAGGRRWRRALAVATCLVLLLAGGAFYLTYRGWNEIHAPFPLDGSHKTMSFEVPVGQSAGQTLELLEQEGALSNALLARLYLVHFLDDPPLQAGEYLIELPQTTPELLGQLVEGRVQLHRVTLVEGLTLEETADHLESEGFGERDAFLSAMNSGDLIADLDPAADNLEGYLFPDTYSFPRGASEAEIVRTLVRTFRQRFAEIQAELSKLAKRSGGSGLRSLVTLASIVEKESGRADELATVAGVYQNRLHIGMGLYADPTVIYALKLAGTWDGNLTRAHLRLDSPYNTYRYPGLPPSPICSPGLASLRAAAAPATVPFLYFVSRNDGSHVFAATLAEHNRNVQKWQRDYWRKR